MSYDSGCSRGSALEYHTIPLVVDRVDQFSTELLRMSMNIVIEVKENRASSSYHSDSASMTKDLCSIAVREGSGILSLLDPLLQLGKEIW